MSNNKKFNKAMKYIKWKEKHLETNHINQKTCLERIWRENGNENQRYLTK